MSLLDIINAGIATANKITKPLQGTVQHYAWTGQDGMGADTFSPVLTSPGTPRQALVDMTRKPRATKDGKLLMTIASLTFLDVIPDNGASGRSEPIDTRDRIILPDGSTGPIVSAGGFMDARTGRPVLNEVLLGEMPGGGA
jgi:hypothetical protein